MSVRYVYDSDGNPSGAIIPSPGPTPPVIKLGQEIQIGEDMAIVHNVEVRYSPGEFTIVNVELMLSHFGQPSNSGIPPLDFAKIFGAPAVANAVNKEIQKQTRAITFDDQ